MSDLEKSKRSIHRPVLAVVMGLVLFTQVQPLVLDDPRYGVLPLAGFLGALASVVPAILLARNQTVGRRRAILILGPAVLAIAISPLILFLLVGPITAGDAGQAAGEGAPHGFVQGLLLWALLGPGDQSHSLVPDDDV